MAKFYRKRLRPENVTEGAIEVFGTLAKKKMFLQVLYQKRFNIFEACLAVNIARQTYYRWAKQDEYFAQGVKEVQLALVDFGVSKLMQCVEEGHFPAIKFFLCNKGDYRETGSLPPPPQQPIQILIEVVGRNGNGEYMGQDKPKHVESEVIENENGKM